MPNNGLSTYGNIRGEKAARGCEIMIGLPQALIELPPLQAPAKHD